jgi:hypothetical protein
MTRFNSEKRRVMANPIPAKGNPSLAIPSRLWILVSCAVEDPMPNHL